MQSVAVRARGASASTASTAAQHLDVAASDLAAQTNPSTSSDPLMDKLATTASSHEDDDTKGSDSWRLQSDASTVSSRVTTPEPHSPPRSISRPPLSSSTTGTTESRTPRDGRSSAIPIPIPAAVPPPPPPSPPGLPTYGELRGVGVATSSDVGQSHVTAEDKAEPQASSWIDHGAAISLSSDDESEEDLIAYKNSRQFPPLLPAHLSTHMSNPRSRSSATNRITNWVTQSCPGSDSSHAEVEQLWQQLKERRGRLRDIRNKMTQVRQELQKLRWQKEEADNSFMTIVRPLLVGQRSDTFLSSLKLLDSRMASMLELREDYHFREASYEQLELELDEEEKEVSGLETKFFSLLSAGQHHGGGSDSAPARRSTTDTRPGVDVDTPYELIGIQADKPLEDIHPLYVEFSAAVGDLENAKEDYRELLFVHSQYEDERSLCDSTGHGLSADAETFLTEFPSDEARLKASISKLEDVAQRLKQLCQEKRVMKKHLSV
ncbi:hypothetical protein EsDP_00003125 [Epichloe bromicola]|uniref:Uncharacterized protein n=1 Tax=Epichloe bromicola TaxID=79588 RepID=A0ABQ0CMV1_9HYPO